MPHAHELLAHARTVMSNAYAPYSNYQVGACLKSEDGQLFSGCNIENASYGLTLCAEASALGALISAGQKRITEIALCCSGSEPCPPCGACLQRIIEFADPDLVIHSSDLHGNTTSITLRELYPQPFNQKHVRGSA